MKKKKLMDILGLSLRKRIRKDKSKEERRNNRQNVCTQINHL